MTVRFKIEISFHGMENLLQKERGWRPAPPFVIYSLQDTKQHCLAETYSKRQQNETIVVQLKSKMPLSLLFKKNIFYLKKDKNKIIKIRSQVQPVPGLQCFSLLCLSEQSELQEPGAR